MYHKWELWCVVYCFAVVTANEIGGFQKNHTVDFIRDRILADFHPGGNQEQPSYPPASEFTNDGVVEDMHEATKSNRIMENSTMAVRDEDPGRFAAVLGSEDTVMSESSVTSAFNREMSNTTVVKASLTLSPLSSAKEMPPHIRMPNSPQRLVVMDQNKKGYFVRCSADGHPEIEYQWLKNDKVLDDTDEYTKAFKNGSLIFTEFSDREDGMFQCMAKNQYGISASVKVPIVIEKPPKALPSGVQVNESYVATEGEPTSFDCADTPPAVPEYTKRWYQLIETIQVPLTNRIGVDIHGVLRFAYVEPTDAIGYICALAPEVAAARGSIRFYNSVIVAVKRKDKINVGPKLVHSTKTVKAAVGSRAILECFFSGYPVPKITWKQGFDTISESDKRFEILFGRRLVILNVREEDAGTFTCNATNGYGTVIESVTLNVTGPPQKIAGEGLDTIVKPAGENTELKCKGRAIRLQHLETPIWFRNGQPFNERSSGNYDRPYIVQTQGSPDSPAFSSRYTFTKDRTELHIRNLNKELDTACFQCNISNSEGYLFYDGFLKVINSLKVIQRPETHVVASNSSDPIDITVRAEGDSCCNIEYKWSFNGSLLLDDEFRKPPFVTESNGDIMFNSSAVDKQTLISKLGNYSCLIFDSHQHLVVSFVISMKAPEPESLIVAGVEDASLWWIGLLCGILLIALAIVIIIVVVKSNYPQNTYPLEKAEIKHHLNPEQDLLDQSFQEF